MPTPTETAGTVEFTAAAKGAAAIGAAGGAQVIEAGTKVGDELASQFADLFVLTPANIASWLAAIFVFCQLCEWWWKRMWRPLIEHVGWLKPKTARPAPPEDDE